MKLLRLLIFVLSAFFCAVSAAGAERPVVWNMDWLERVRETLPGNRLCRRALSDLRRRCDSFPYEQINERRLALDDIARQLLRADAYAGNKEFRRLYDRYGAEPEDPIFILFHLIN